jgi:DNA-binding transcriptional LysR family regulator
VTAAPRPQPDRGGWTRVELRQLVTLVAIARAGSFRGAASALGYAQSSVSQRIGVLEATFGVRLVDRSATGGVVGLTAEGQVLAMHAAVVIEEVRTAYAAICGTAAREDEKPGES